MINLTVIISYYKALENLKLILKALSEQSCTDFEVIISEDDYNEETLAFVADAKNKYPYRITHLCQLKDNGFRKNMMLNRSVVRAEADTLAFIDGDCIPHKHFVKSYLSYISDNAILWGRRVMLGAKKTEYILSSGRLKKVDFLSLLLSDSNKIKDGIYSPRVHFNFKFRGVKGCNWGVKKKHLLDINGFDEDYVRAGVGEDDDVSWRLIQNGLKPVSLKNRAIVYHLYHKRGYSNDGVRLNREMFISKKHQKNIVCKNGIRKD